MSKNQNHAQESDGNSQMPKICDTNFEYVNSKHTDVMKTFKRFGFQEPDRQRQIMTKLALNRLVN